MESEKENLTISPMEPLDDATLSRGANSILLLPLGWGPGGGETAYSESTQSVSKLFSQHGIPSETLSPITAETDLKQDRYADWVAPTLLVSNLLISQNPMAVSLALNLLANYVTELFKGVRSDPRVKLRIVQAGQGGQGSRQLNYDGPVSGLPDVARVVAEFKPGG